MDLGARAVAGQRQQAPLLAQPAAMGKQVADRDRHAIVRHLRQIAPDIIVEREFAVLNQQQHGGGGELLGERAGLKDRVRCDRHRVLEIGQAIAANHRRRAVDRHACCAAGHRRRDRCECRVKIEHWPTLATSGRWAIAVLSRRSPCRTHRSAGQGDDGDETHWAHWTLRQVTPAQAQAGRLPNSGSVSAPCER